MIEPEKSEDDDTDPTSVNDEDRSEAAPLVRRGPGGRLLPGSVLNPRGRPKGSGARPRLIDVARDLAERGGFALEDALGAVTEAMLKRAANGDVEAARLILGRLAVDEHDGRGPAIVLESGPPIPEGADLADYLDQLRAVNRELQAETAGRITLAPAGHEALDLAAQNIRLRAALDEADAAEVEELLR